MTPMPLHPLACLLLAVALLLILPAGNAAAQPRNPYGVAVIVGNKDYRHRDVPPVDFAHNDAEAIRHYVIDVLGFDPANVHVLKNAGKADLEAAFGTRETEQGMAWRLLEPDGRSDLLVYYSGHGVPGLSSGRSYLLPADVDPLNAELGGFPVQLLYDNLAKLRTRSVTVVLDACFSGQSDKGKLIAAASPVVRQAPAKPTDRLTVLAAGAADQVASWDRQSRHGLFTEQFLSGVYGAADDPDRPHRGNGDGQVTLAELRAYLEREVPRQARREFGRDQVPDIRGETTTVLATFLAGRRPQRPALGVSPTVPAVARVPAPPPVSLAPAPSPARPGGAGQSFTDCPECPAMTVIPPGDFVMGSETGDADELQPHLVTIGYSFAIGRFEVTFDEWDACVAAGTCRHRPDDRGWGRGAQPVINVNWNDAMEYVKWLSARTGKRYRLPSEAEWEYVARGGQEDDVSGIGRAHCQGCGTSGRGTLPVGVASPANSGGPFQVADMLGNVWEWVADCRSSDYSVAPDDGSAVLNGACSFRGARGGSWMRTPVITRAANRSFEAVSHRSGEHGFRVVREMR